MTDKRAALYARVSKGEEADETTIGIQLARCEAFCEAHGWTVVAKYQDVGISGFDRTAVRPEYERMLKGARGGEFDALVIFKLDRLTRQLRQVSELIEMVQETGIEFASVNDSIDTSTPTGRLMLAVMAALAQMESENTSLRVRTRLEDNARKGKLHRGAPDRRPFGWSDDWATLHPEEAPILQEGVQRYIDGCSMGDMVRWMNEQGVLTPKGNPLNVSQMSKILRNPRLLGLRNFRGTELIESPVEAVVTPEVWDRLQTRLGGGTVIINDIDGKPLKIAQPANRRRAGRASVLTGLLVCTRCEQLMRYSGGATPRYLCVGLNCSAVNAARVEAIVYKEARELLTGLQLYRRPSTESSEPESAPEPAERRLLLTRQLDRVLMDIYTGTPSEVEREALERLRMSLLAQIEALDASTVAQSGHATPDARGRWSHDDWWEAATNTEKREACRYLFERINVRPQDKVRQELGGGRIGWDVLTKNRLHIILNEETFGPRDYEPVDWHATDAK